MHFKIIIGFLFICNLLVAQGPPITGDKPIMLGSNRVILKTLTEIRNLEEGTAVNAPVMVHYTPTANTLVAIHLPMVFWQENVELGDIQLLGKYQFYRKDKTGKTLRAVLKTIQTLPTGKDFNLVHISTGDYQSYQGVVLGYETIKYGITSELGLNIVPSSNLDELIGKIGFGLPILKPVYPVNQVNLLFEYRGSWYPSLEGGAVYYAQGVQYARKRWTWEVALQLPLLQENTPMKREYSLFLGTRFVF